MNDAYRALRVDDDGHGVLTVAIDAPPMNLVGPESVRADAKRFQRLVASDAGKARTATLFAQGLQTRSELELELGRASRRWLVKAASLEPIVDVDSVDEHVVSGHEPSTT